MAAHQEYSTLNSSQHESDGDVDSADHRLTTRRSSIVSITPDTAASQMKTTSHTVNQSNPESQPQGPRTDTIGHRDDWNSWRWEIGGVTLSVVGVALLISFLAKIQDTSYESWQYTVSPNTVMSIIVTSVKAALLVPVSACLSQLKWNQYRNPAPLYHMQAIDQASRGPLGCLEVLWRSSLGRKMGSLTRIGAITTILTLAIDPFTQQILSFPARTVPALDETASVQSAHEYYPVESYWDYEFTPTPSIFTSILTGMLRANRPLEPQCSSTSCDYPPFVTLGICSHCEDVTDRTNQTCHPLGHSVENDGLPDYMGKIPAANCTYTSPDGFLVSVPFADALNFSPAPAETFIPGKFNLNYWASYPKDFGEIFGILSPILSFITTKYSVSVYYTPENVTAPLPKPSLTECVVYYCERQYPASSYVPGNQNSSPLRVSRTQQLMPTYIPSVRQNYAGLNKSVLLGPPYDTETLSRNSSYSVDFNTFNNLENTLVNLFNYTLSNGTYMSRISGQSVLSMAEILSAAEISQMLDSISTSITDNFRANPKSDSVPGKAFRVETFIDVRWPWIILPVCTVLGSLILLLGTAIASKQQHAVLWKSSVLPLLMSQLDTIPEHGIASLRNVDEIHRISKKIDVTMDQVGDVLVFTEQ